MTEESRERFARVVRDPRCDLAEAALLCCVEVEADLDVEVELLRLDALADGLVTSGFSQGTAHNDARALASYLHGRLGFTGDAETYRDPRNGLLTTVLDRKRGLPIALAILYVAIGRRAGIAAYGVNTPGHFLVGVTGRRTAARRPELPVVVDPFHDGQVLSEAEIAERVQSSTAGMEHFHPAMLRPTAPHVVIRRVLNNLTRDFLGQGDVEDALWTAELKLLLPDADIGDARVTAELLVQLGSYRSAAELLEERIAAAPVSADLEDVARLALHARSKMN